MINVMSENRICSLLQIRYPIIQAGMVWCSGWKLASAVSNKGGLGLIGSGSMYPETLRDHIRKCKEATRNSFGVNVPLLYPEVEKTMQVIMDEDVKIVFTSAGNPARFTPWLKEHGITVVHVVPNVSLARKCEEKGVDAVVCEGFEAGGHNGKDEITTMCLIPQVADNIEIPIIAAGGIGDGRAIAAVLSLGADGVQIGSRFAVTQESSAHFNFKNVVAKADDSATILTLKKIIPVRMLKNKFYEQVQEAENNCAEAKQLRLLLGRGRAKKGIFEGDLDEGELEIGQISGLINDIPTAAEVFDRLIDQTAASINRLEEKKNVFTIT